MSARKELVVALDGSDSGYRALKVGAGLAQAMGRELGVLYVFPHHSGFSAAFSGLDEQATKEGLDEMKKRSATEVFEEADTRLGSAGRITSRHLLSGDPAEEIIEFVEQNPGVHLVMGRRGLSTIKALVMGSVSNKVAAHAPGPVTII